MDNSNNQKPASSQLKNFIETARSLGCDESEEAFNAKLKAIAAVKPTTQAEVKEKAKQHKE